MATTERERPERGSLYEKVASSVARLISHGTFRPGERVPSVRRLSQQFKVSVTTVLDAYRLLESQGLLEARPQSGYFVCPRYPALPAEPEISQPDRAPTHVSIAELVIMVLRDTRSASLLQLGAAVPDPALLPTAKLNQILCTIARLQQRRSSAYEVVPGCKSLRVQIARRSLSAGCALTPDELVITSGAQEAVYLALAAICRPGDTVAIESPIFFGILQAIESLRLRAVEVPTHPREGLSLPDLRQILRRSRIKAVVVISNFNNPLGSSIPEENKRELVEMLSQRDIPLIEDDLCGDLGHLGERPVVAKAFDKKNLVLLCSSFSKTLAPGYRVGWIAPGRFRMEVERLKVVTNIAAPTLPQLAISEFLSNGGYDPYLQRVRRTYAQQVASMARAVAQHFPPETRVTRPAGGFVLWVELPGYADSLRLYESALEAGMTIAPGPIFSAKKRYRNFIRLNCASFSPEIEGAVARLGGLVAAMKDDVSVQ